jgi:hypothetical protein
MSVLPFSIVTLRVSPMKTTAVASARLPPLPSVAHSDNAKKHNLDKNVTPLDLRRVMMKKCE